MASGKKDATTAVEAFQRWAVAALSAAVAESCTYPLDTTKIRLQLQGEMAAAAGSGKAAMKRGMVATFMHVAKTEGVSGLYGGLSAALLRQVVYGGIGVGLYEPVRKLLIGDQDAKSAPLWKRVLAGMITGGTGQLIASPTDVVKVRMQADGRLRLLGQEPRYSGPFDAFRRIPAEEGIKGFFSGVRPSVTRAAIINGCGIASYDHTKQMTLKLTGQQDGIVPRVIGSLISGLVSAVVSTPMDVVKTRLMNQPAKATLYTGMLDCAVKTVRGEGLMALYKGFMPAYARLAPWQLVFFLSFETLNKAAFGKAL